MSALVKGLDLTLRWSLVSLATFMILTVSWQVISRYGFRAPSSVTEELARFQLIWLGLLGAVYTFRTRMHVGIDLLVSRLRGRRRIVAEVTNLVACLIFALSVLLYGGGRLVVLTHELDQISAALGIRISYVYAILPISGVWISVYSIYFILDALFRGKIHLPESPDHLVGDFNERGAR